MCCMHIKPPDEPVMFVPHTLKSHHKMPHDPIIERTWFANCYGDTSTEGNIVATPFFEFVWKRLDKKKKIINFKLKLQLRVYKQSGGKKYRDSQKSYEKDN